MIHTFDFGIYPRKLFVVFGKDIEKEIKKFASREGYEIKIEYDTSLGCACKVQQIDTRKLGFIVWIKDKKQPLSVLAHEATHIALDLCDDLDIKAHLDNQEPIAYLVGWVVECILKAKSK